uniref:Bacteriocin resistance YdeI/OmpD-like protein n=1 Tax=Gracilinema caldarium TaxID=215591 RepID=A0A7C3IF35_9SPIR
MIDKIPGGIAHELPKDIESALSLDATLLDAWVRLTPIARNEWICWVISPKKAKTREQHIKRMISELKEGKHRPCCWMGCIHRTEKELSPSQKFLLTT